MPHGSIHLHDCAIIDAIGRAGKAAATFKYLDGLSSILSLTCLRMLLIKNLIHHRIAPFPEMINIAHLIG
jgi:hypothetical protein